MHPNNLSCTCHAALQSNGQATSVLVLNATLGRTSVLNSSIACDPDLADTEPMQAWAGAANTTVTLAEAVAALNSTGARSAQLWIRGLVPALAPTSTTQASFLVKQSLQIVGHAQSAAAPVLDMRGMSPAFVLSNDTYASMTIANMSIINVCSQAMGFGAGITPLATFGMGFMQHKWCVVVLVTWAGSQHSA